MRAKPYPSGEGRLSMMCPLQPYPRVLIHNAQSPPPSVSHCTAKNFEWRVHVVQEQHVGGMEGVIPSHAGEAMGDVQMWIWSDRSSPEPSGRA